MGFFSRLRETIGMGEPVVIDDFESADNFFLDLNKEKIEKLEERSKSLCGDVEEGVEDLRNDLRDLKDFSDEEDRAVIEDNVENFVDNKLSLLKGLDNFDDVEVMYSSFSDVMEELNSIDDKTEAVLDEANVGSEFSKSLKNLTKLLERTDNFIKSDYQTVKRKKKLEEKVQELKDYSEEKQVLEEELAELEQNNLKQRITEKKKSLQELEESSVKDEFNSLKDDLQDREVERSQLLNKIGSSMGKMERGLKKLLHEGKISKISSEESEILRDIRDGEKSKLLQKEPGKVEKAAKAVEESTGKNFLQQSTQKKLLDGTKFFLNFSDKKEKLENLQEKTNNLEADIQNHKYLEKKESIQKEVKNLREEQEKILDEKKEIKGKIENAEYSIEQLKSEILELFDQEFNAEVEISSTKN